MCLDGQHYVILFLHVALGKTFFVTVDSYLCCRAPQLMTELKYNHQHIGIGLINHVNLYKEEEKTHSKHFFQHPQQDTQLRQTLCLNRHL